MTLDPDGAGIVLYFGGTMMELAMLLRRGQTSAAKYRMLQYNHSVRGNQ